MVAARLVRRTEDFDDSDHHVVRALSAVNLKVGLVRGLAQDHVDGDNDRIAGDWLGHGNAARVRIASSSGCRATGTQNVDVRLKGRPMPQIQPNMLASSRIIRPR